jgi:hypothetical protein
MAKVLSGSISTNAYGSRYLVLSWTATQSIANNSTTVSWTLKGAGGSTTSWYEAGNFKVVLAGETVYNSSARIKLYNGTTVASGTKVINHNTDGTKSISASVQAGIYYVAVNCTGSGSWDLKDIPRAATITAAPNFNDTENPTVSFSNPAGNAVDALDICITLAGNNADVPYRAVTKTGSSYTFALTDAERKTLRAATTGANSRSVGFYLRTKIGGVDYYSKVWKTFSVVNGAPTLSISAKDTGGNSTKLTGDGNKYLINGFNVIAVATGATAKKEATIKSQSIKCGDQTINAATGTFANVKTTDGKVTFTATDSRNNKVTASKTFTVIPYFAPTINLAKRNVSTDGVFTIGITGTFFNGSFGAVNNAITLQYRWKAGSADWGDWVTVTPTINGNNYSFAGDKTGLDYQETYKVQVRVTDSLKSLDSIYIYSNEYAASAVPVFDWGKGDFRHNTSIVFANNKNIYGITNEGEWIAALQPCNTANNCILGYGGYAAGIGNTNIYGDSVNIMANKSIKINSTALADFVVEQGTSGIWNYRKWNSGLGECWGIVTVTTKIDTAWGSMYCGSTKMSRQNYPFTFTSKPSETASLTAGGSAAWMFPESSGNGVNGAYASAIYNVCRPSAVSTAQTFYINLHAVGRWK